MKTICIILIFLCASLVAEDKVKYTFEVVAPGTIAPIKTVKLGKDFDLTMSVGDLRQDNGDRIRGVFAAYVDILYDKRLASIRVAEVQRINFANLIGVFKLSRGAQGHSQSTASIQYDLTTPTLRVLTANNIETAINKSFGTRLSHSAPGTLVKVFQISGQFYIHFVGQYDVDQPLLVDNSQWVTLSEYTKGDIRNVASYQGAFQFSENYPNGKHALSYSDRMKEVGAFSNSFNGLGAGDFEVCRVRLLAKKLGTVTFTPNFDTLEPYSYDTLVYGNLTADPPEQSLVAKNEILAAPVSVKVIQ